MHSCGIIDISPLLHLKTLKGGRDGFQPGIEIFPKYSYESFISQATIITAMESMFWISNDWSIEWSQKNPIISSINVCINIIYCLSKNFSILIFQTLIIYVLLVQAKKLIHRTQRLNYCFHTVFKISIEKVGVFHRIKIRFTNNKI